jgi:hypothetical protein
MEVDVVSYSRLMGPGRDMLEDDLILVVHRAAA